MIKKIKLKKKKKQNMIIMKYVPIIKNYKMISLF